MKCNFYKIKKYEILYYNNKDIKDLDVAKSKLTSIEDVLKTSIGDGNGDLCTFKKENKRYLGGSKKSKETKLNERVASYFTKEKKLLIK
jgi:hypothetical protein